MKGFGEKFGPKSPDFEEFFYLIAINTQYVPAGRQNIPGFLNFFISSLTCSQILLIFLVNDHQCGYITTQKKNLGHSH
jgi:hypothetical protein